MEEDEVGKEDERGRNAPSGQRSGHGPLQLGLGRADLMPGKTWSSATAPSPPRIGGSIYDRNQNFLVIFVNYVIL